MAIFSKPRAAMSTVEPAIQAAVGGSYTGNSQVGNFTNYTDGQFRQRALQLATLSRARDLICGTIAGLNLEMYREIWNGDDMEPTPLAPRSWLARIDRSVPNNFILSWTIDDLIFEGRAFWYVDPNDRTADGYPNNFTRLPAAMISTLDQQGPVFYGPSKQIYFNGLEMNPRDIIQFLSPLEGLRYTGQRVVETALRIEDARMRNAMSAIPAGILRQTENSEPMSAQELSDLAAQFNLARTTNQTAALNQYLTYTETAATPDKMMLIESADYSSREIGRLLGCPPFLLSLSVGAYSYQSSQQSRMDLWQYACRPLAECITETLSSDNVLPHGTLVKFDVDDFLAENYMGGDIEEGVDMPGDEPANPQGIPQMAVRQK